MPWKPPIHNGKRFERKESDKRYDVGRANNAARKIRGTMRWKRVREMAMNRCPLCFDPFQEHKRFGVVQPTDHIHHVIGINENHLLAFDLENLVGLCVQCHNKIESMERNGKETKHYFAGRYSNV